MKNVKQCVKNTVFNGNKNCPGNTGANRFFCCFKQDRKETGLRLSRARQAKDYNSREFVEYLEREGFLRISLTTLWKWETGRCKIGDEELEALCAALGLRRDELVSYRRQSIADERDQLVPLLCALFNVSAAAPGKSRLCGFFY